jgi:hypothetical protein
MLRRNSPLATFPDGNARTGDEAWRASRPLETKSGRSSDFRPFAVRSKHAAKPLISSDFLIGMPVAVPLFAFFLATAAPSFVSRHVSVNPLPIS